MIDGDVERPGSNARRGQARLAVRFEPEATDELMLAAILGVALNL